MQALHVIVMDNFPSLIIYMFVYIFDIDIYLICSFICLFPRF